MVNLVPAPAAILGSDGLLCNLVTTYLELILWWNKTQAFKKRLDSSVCWGYSFEQF